MPPLREDKAEGPAAIPPPIGAFSRRRPRRLDVARGRGDRPLPMSARIRIGLLRATVAAFLLVGPATVQITFRKREVTDADVLEVLERVRGMVKGNHKPE